MYKVIYTFARRWPRPVVTIEHDPENEKPWCVRQKDTVYPFRTFRECLCYCFGRGLLPMYEAVDYCDSKLPERLKEL